jgi:hypothetical protein
MVTLLVTKYLSPSVKDNKDSLARQTRVQVKEKVVNAKGTLKKFEVLKGSIFIDVDTAEAAKAVKDMFDTVKEAVTEELEPLQAIFMKSQRRPTDPD